MSSPLARLLCEKVFCPTIMVETSSPGLAAASIDFQSTSQLLQDFCDRNCLDHISQLFHLCCAGDKASYPGFSALRFVSESDINAACVACELPLSLPLSAPFSQFRNKSSTPWFDVYRRKFFLSAGNTRTSETDTFLHPLACIYAVCSNDVNPIESLTKTQISFPPFMDPNPLKIFLLIDFRGGSNVDASALLEKMKRSLGQNCYLLTLSSNNAARSESPFRAEDVLELIDIHHPNTRISPDSKVGLHLSDEDVRGIKKLTKEIVQTTIIPFMEKSIQFWNEQIASSRKGFTGKLFSVGKRYFGTVTSGSKGNTPSTSSMSISSNATGYFPGTPEFQLRKLADYAFMMGDYKLAFSTYETVKKDYQNDKQWKFFSSALEMMGVCVFISPESGKDEERHLELAALNYLTKTKDLVRASFVTFVLAENLISKRQFREATVALLRIAYEEEDIRSGLFFEQTAWLFQSLNRSAFRRSALYMFMAGQKYRKSSLAEYSRNCYLLSLDLVKGKGWSIMEDHLNFILANYSISISKDYDESIRYFTQLIHESRQSPNVQTQYCKEFSKVYEELCRQKGDRFWIKGLFFPEPRHQSAMVTSSTTNLDIQGKDWDLWKNLEMNFSDANANLKSLEDERGVSGTSKMKKQAFLNKAQDRSAFALEEPVLFSVDIKNPLQIPITLKKTFLICQYSSESKISGAKTWSPASFPDHIKPSNVSPTSAEYDAPIVDEFLINAGGTRKLTLTILPKKKGFLRILGFHASIFENVPILVLIDKKGKRLNSKKEERMIVTYAQDTSLELIITSPMPLLDVVFHGVPQTLASGEVCKCTVELLNRGKVGLKNLLCKISHPCFVSMGSYALYESDFYDTRGGQGGQVENFTVSNKLEQDSVSKIALPPYSIDNLSEIKSQVSFLPPGNSALIPVWFRGDKVGSQTIRFLFRYESIEKQEDLIYRTVKYQTLLQTVPSIKINGFSRPSLRNMDEFVIGLQMENNFGEETCIKINQIAAISSSWVICQGGSDSRYYSHDFYEKAISHDASKQIFFNVSRRRSNDEKDQAFQVENLVSKTIEKVLEGVNGCKLPNHEIPLMSSFLRKTSNESGIPNCIAGTLVYGMIEKYHQNWRLCTLVDEFPSFSRDNLMDLFPLYATEELDLVVFWEAKGKDGISRRGHHSMPGMRISSQSWINVPALSDPAFIARVTNSLYMETKRERISLISALNRSKVTEQQSPMKIKFSSPNSVSFDYKGGSLLIPVKFDLKNCSWSLSLYYEICLPDIKRTGNKSSSKSFTWSGDLLKLQGHLKPGETVTIKSQILVTSPGVYNVNNWSLSTFSKEIKNFGFIQNPDQPHYIQVI